MVPACALVCAVCTPYIVSHAAHRRVWLCVTMRKRLPMHAVPPLSRFHSAWPAGALVATSSAQRPHSHTAAIGATTPLYCTLRPHSYGPCTACWSVVGRVARSSRSVVVVAGSAKKTRHGAGSIVDVGGFRANLPAVVRLPQSPVSRACHAA